MDDAKKREVQDKAKREFLSCLGSALTCGIAASIAGSVTTVADATSAQAAGAAPEPEIPGYDWSQHKWAFGVDATKCIGCLRCVEACKKENNVPRDAHQFPTGVERYQT